MSDKLPFSNEAERGLLCSLMLHPKAIAPALAERKVTAAQFHVPAHQAIFAAIMALWGEEEAIDAIKARAILPGEVMVLIGIGPSFGMPETYQVTAALKHIDAGGLIPLITDGRFSGVSTGPCVGHVTPEAQISRGGMP